MAIAVKKEKDNEEKALTRRPSEVISRFERERERMFKEFWRQPFTSLFEPRRASKTKMKDLIRVLELPRALFKPKITVILNRHLLPQLLLALVAATMLASQPALAGPALNFHASLKGQLAEAYFDSTDSSGCVETFVYIFAQKAIDKETGQPEQGPQAYLLLFQNDFCSGVPLIEATGSAPLTEATFQIDRKLSSAKLDAILEVCDSVSDTCFPVDVHLIWTSSGGPYRLKEHRQIQAAGLKISSRYDGITREGTASGTLTYGTTNLCPETAFSVNLASVRFGEVDLLD